MALGVYLRMPECIGNQQDSSPERFLTCCVLTPFLYVLITGRYKRGGRAAEYLRHLQLRIPDPYFVADEPSVIIRQAS